jgi:adenine-specific DNA methylase
MNPGSPSSSRLIERWFPVAAVDEACGTPTGSGQNEKAIFTWFASRPIAQARAAVLCSLLEEQGAEGDNELRKAVELYILTGDSALLNELAGRIADVDGKRPVVLDCFSGRGIIPLEAARLGLRAVGIDWSPVAVLGSRLLADWALRDWSGEPIAPFAADAGDGKEGVEESRLVNVESSDPKLISDLRRCLAEVDRRVCRAVEQHFPRKPDGSLPWGYLWAITIPCDTCRRRFPLIGSLLLRAPYASTGDLGQSFEIVINEMDGTWRVVVNDGRPTSQPTYVSGSGKRGKSARCPFCEHNHSLDTVKAKSFACEFEDAPLVAADLVMVEAAGASGRTRQVERKVFRSLTPEEVAAATNIDVKSLPRFGDLPAAPIEPIAPGNVHAVRGTGYGCKTWADLMNKRQIVLLRATVQAIRAVYDDCLAAGISTDYAAALAAYMGANVVRRLRYSTRGARLQVYTDRPAVGVGDVFENESAISSNTDWFETGPGQGPGTWGSLATLAPLRSHVQGLTSTALPARFRQGTATALPYRTGTVDAVVVDPPYYSMIDYADISDLFYVWLRRCLFDIVPDLFADAGDGLGLQDKSQEIIVKDSAASSDGRDHRTTEWYETQLFAAFREMRRVLKPDGVLTVVFGHSDPDAWRRLLRALRDAGFVVTSAWPARTESANTGVASIKVTVTIGCRTPPEGRRGATAAHVEREITNLIRDRVKQWDAWGLALSDQLMASYGPAMEVVGRYRSIERPDSSEPDLDYFLSIGRRAVGEAHAFKVDELPLDTFDPVTRFAIFWLRAFARTAVNKGEAVFHAQSSQMRIDDLRPSVLVEVKGGYAISLDEPPPITERSPVIHVARALGAAWPRGGTEAAAKVVADAGLSPDDSHLWATVAELVRQLPESDKLAMALTACQRNRRPIETATRQSVNTGEQLMFDQDGGA